MGDLGLIPRLGRSLGEGKDYPLQYSGLGNSTDCIVHGIAKSQILLSDFHNTFYPNKMRKFESSKDTKKMKIKLQSGRK